MPFRSRPPFPLRATGSLDAPVAPFVSDSNHRSGRQYFATFLLQHLCFASTGALSFVRFHYLRTVCALLPLSRVSLDSTIAPRFVRSRPLGYASVALRLLPVVSGNVRVTISFIFRRSHIILGLNPRR